MSCIPGAVLHATSNPDTTRVDMKLLVRLHDSLSYAEFRRVRSWFFANLLHVDVTSIRTSLRHLDELGYLERGERDGDSFTFRLKEPQSGNSPPPTLSAAKNRRNKPSKSAGVHSRPRSGTHRTRPTLAVD